MSDTSLSSMLYKATQDFLALAELMEVKGEFGSVRIEDYAHIVKLMGKFMHQINSQFEGGWDLMYTEGRSFAETRKRVFEMVLQVAQMRIDEHESTQGIADQQGLPDNSDIDLG